MSRSQGLALCAVLSLSACGDAGEDKGNDVAEIPAESTLQDRAYIVSLESDELTVIDTNSWEVIGRVSTGGIENHMAETTADFTKIFVDSSHSDEVVVVDAKALEVTKRLPLGKHPAHLNLTPDGKLLAIML